MRLHTRGEILADRQIHIIGIFAALVGTIVLCADARPEGTREYVSVLVYCTGLIAMLVCSAAYNTVSSPSWTPLLRRFDHAAIFVMIAGTYTPFTVNRLVGGWSVAMTASVWGIAIVAGVLKFVMPHRLERYSLLLYLALGWIGLIAGRQLLIALDTETLVLLGIGGALYSLGTIFHTWRALKYQNAIWHGFVLTAACFHYAAVLHQVAPA
jgi:hemolysin III